MLEIEKDITAFKLDKSINRLLWVTLSIIEELYADGSNFSEEELNRIRKQLKEEGYYIKKEMDDFLKNVEVTSISIKKKL